MKRSLSLFAAAVALALTATAQSQADPLTQPDPFGYTYTWKATTNNSLDPRSISAGTGGVLLTSGDSNTSGRATDGPATNITVFSAVLGGSPPDSIPVPTLGNNYSLAVALTDNAGVGAGTITFTGLLQGELTNDSSNLSNVITGVTDGSGAHPGQSFGSVTFDNMLYTVTYAGFAPPGSEKASGVGAISFHIDFGPAVVGNPSPEPSSMVLGCLGLSFLGGVVLRARRRKAELLKAAF